MNPAEPVLRSLLMRGLEGDGAAYHAFLRQLGAHLRAYLGRRLFGWPDDVEDLVQECLIAMHNQRHTYQPDQPFTAWAHAIARYKMIDLLRTRSGREALHEPLDDEMALFADSAVEADIPGVSAIECGNYRDHSLHTAREWAKVVLDQGISLDAFARVGV